MADTARARGRSEAFSAAWGGPFVVGLLMAVVGLLAFFSSVLTSFVTVLFLGVLLVLAGLFEIVHAFRVWHEGRPLRFLLGGLLSIVVGFLYLVHPAAGLQALALLLAGYFFVSGLFRGITAVADRYPHWGWDFVYGISAVILGIIILGEWPLSALWVVGALVGLEIFFRGIALMGGSLAVRQALHAPRRAPA